MTLKGLLCMTQPEGINIMRDASAWRAILIVFVIALLLRLAYLAIVSVDSQNWYSMDSVIYTGLAQGMLETGTFSRSVGDGSGYVQETERVPLYAVYLAAFLETIGDNPIWPLAGQTIISALICVVIGLLAQEVRPDAFFPAGLLAAFNLNLIVHSAIILSDVLFVLFFSLHLLTLVWCVKRSKAKHGLLAGLYLGLALMTRPIVLYWIPVCIAVMLCVALVRSRFRPRALLPPVLMVSAVIVIAGPLFIRNYLQFGYFSLVSQTGTAALNWYVPLVKDFSQGQPWNVAAKEMRARLQTYLDENYDGVRPENSFESSAVETKVALQELRKLSLKDVAYAWLGGATINLFAPSTTSISLLDRMERPRFYQTPGANFITKAWNFLTHPGNRIYLLIMIPGLLSTLIFRAFLVGGIIHSWLTMRDARATVILYLLATAYMFAITGPLVSAARYRLPVEPILTTFTGVAILATWRWWKNRGSNNNSPSAILK